MANDVTDRADQEGKAAIDAETATKQKGHIWHSHQITSL
jgi:hypothetical protein